jgi:hypothetical protein
MDIGRTLYVLFGRAGDLFDLGQKFNLPKVANNLTSKAKPELIRLKYSCRIAGKIASGFGILKTY